LALTFRVKASQNEVARLSVWLAGLSVSGPL
jgi:hypothetical protein